MNNVLIVDDDKDVIKVLEMVLPDYGFNARGVSRSDEIFNIMPKFLPQVILLDVNLEDEDGRFICNDLKTQYLTRKIPVILISGNDKVKEDVEYFMADDFILKPIDTELLVSRLRWFTDPSFFNLSPIV